MFFTEKNADGVRSTVKVASDTKSRSSLLLEYIRKWPKTKQKSSLSSILRLRWICRERKNEDAFERLMDGSMGHIPPIVEICHYEHLRLIFLFLIISVHEENGCTRSPQFVIVWVRPNWDCFQKQAGCVRLLQRDLWASYRFKLGSPLKTFLSKTVNGGVTMWDLPRLHRLSILLANSCAHNSSLAIPWGAGHMCPCCP